MTDGEPGSPAIKAFFDEATNTISYLVWDPRAKRGAVIDPVLDYDPATGKVDVGSVDAILAAAKAEAIDIEWVLETHAHADHLSGAPYIKARTGARIGVGEHIKDVQRIFRPIFNATDLATDGRDFDRLLVDGERLALGGIAVEVLHTPGHTPADVSYRIGDCVFVGDTIFMPDYGTARTDFPGGDAHHLYRSIQRLLALPSKTRLFMCHDYKAPGRDHYAWETTVEAERKGNIHLRNCPSEAEFVAQREERDRTLETPRLLLPSIQVNIRAGRFPPAESNGVRYLMIPVTPKTDSDRIAVEATNPASR